MIRKTAGVYVQAYETITGQAFEPPPPGEDILARIRDNLARYFT